MKLLRDIDLFERNEDKKEWFEKMNENAVDIEDQMKQMKVLENIGLQ